MSFFKILKIHVSISNIYYISWYVSFVIATCVMTTSTRFVLVITLKSSSVQQEEVAQAHGGIQTTFLFIEHNYPETNIR
jgi:hypothetical protein